MTDEEPIGRAKWTGTSEPRRRSMEARRSQAGHVFVAQRGAESDWHDVYELDALERFEVDEEYETEWYT